MFDLIPEFGAMKIGDIAPVHVREWITRLKTASVSASTIADVKTVLSAVFTTASNDQIVAVHPVRGVKTPTVARRPRTIVTPEQFDAIHAALPDESWRMLIKLDVETGLRWGELTELRVRDVNPATRMLTVARAVIEVNAPFRDADAGRFRVKEYPKGVPPRQALPRHRRRTRPPHPDEQARAGRPAVHPAVGD